MIKLAITLSRIEKELLYTMVLDQIKILYDT